MAAMTIGQHREEIDRIETQRARARGALGIRAAKNNITDSLIMIEARQRLGDAVVDAWKAEDTRLYRQALAHADAVNAGRQAVANARQAKATQAATCKSCYTVHPGECY